jgi:uncharacterized membrane protein YfcA
MMTLPFVFACIAIFLAAIVRGYSGFGFSLLAISALSLVYAPSEIVPSIFLLEVAASLHLLPGVWKDIHWRSLLPLIIGCLVATPFGVWLLANIPPATMQIGIGIFVLVAVSLMWFGYALKSIPGPFAATLVGAASGLANGATGIGGPPVILFYFSTPAGQIAGRASVIAFFLATDLIGLANQSRYDLVTMDSGIRALLFLPVLVAGIWLGSRSFKSANPEQFRRWVIVIMAVLGALVLAKGVANF